MLLYIEWVNEEIKQEMKTYMETRKTKDKEPKIFGMWQNSKRKDYSNTTLPQKTRKSFN